MTSKYAEDQCIDVKAIASLSETMLVWWLCRLNYADYVDMWWSNLI